VSQSDPTTPSTDPISEAADAGPAEPATTAAGTAPKPAAKKAAQAAPKPAAGATAKPAPQATKKAAAKKSTAKKPAAKKTAPKAAANKAEPEATPVPTRSPEEIQADIDAAQQRLADTVDALSDRLTPASLAEEATSSVKGVFVDSAGRVKPKPIAIIGGAIAGLMVLRAIFHRD
jgi:hypothetical protein